MASSSSGLQTGTMSPIALNILRELSAARTDDARVRAVRRLREYVRVESRAGTDISFSPSLQSLYEHMRQLLFSNVLSEQIAGLFALYELIEEPVPDNESKLLLFSDFVKNLLTMKNDTVVIRLTAKCLGRLARVGGVTTNSYVVNELEQALDWLEAGEPRIEIRKMTCVLVLRELAESVPKLFFPYSETFFTHIWSALSDPKVQIREAAAQALGAVLALISKRKCRSRDEWYSNLFTRAYSSLLPPSFPDANVSLTSNTRYTDEVHGALLLIGELLNAASNSDRLLMESTRQSRTHAGVHPSDPFSASSQAPRYSRRGPSPVLVTQYSNLCEVILRHKDSRDRYVRKTVVSVIPSLAQLNPDVFVENFASTTLAHFLVLLGEDEKGLRKNMPHLGDKSTAFSVIGALALVLGSRLASPELRSYLERILEGIHHTLLSSPNPVPTQPPPPPKAKSAGRATRISQSVTQAATATPAVTGKHYVSEALACLGKIVQAVGPLLTETVHTLLGPMSSEGLSLTLADSLAKIMGAIPAMKTLIQEKILNEISLILAGRPFIYPFADPAGKSALLPLPPWITNYTEEGNGGVDKSGPKRAYRAPENAYGLSETDLSAFAGVVTPSSLLSALLNAGPPSNSSGMSASNLVASYRPSNPQEVMGFVSAPFAAGVGPNAAFVTGETLVPASIVASRLTNTSARNSYSWSRYLASMVNTEELTDKPSLAKRIATVAPQLGWSYALHHYALLAPHPIPARARGVSSTTVCTALHILGTFDFSDVPLIPYVKEVVSMYFSDPDPAIRVESVVTATRIVLSPTEVLGGEYDLFLRAASFDANTELAQEMSFSLAKGWDTSSLFGTPGVSNLEDYTSLCLDADNTEDRVIGVDVLGPIASKPGEENPRKVIPRELGSHSLSYPNPKLSSSTNASVSFESNMERWIFGGLQVFGGLPTSDLNSGFSAPSLYAERLRRRAWYAHYKALCAKPNHSHPLLVQGIDAYGIMSLHGGKYVSPIESLHFSTLNVPALQERFTTPTWLTHNANRFTKDPVQPLDSRDSYGDGGLLLDMVLRLPGGGGPTLAIISEILEKMLVAATIDTDPVVRYQILSCLTSSFDPVLESESCINLLKNGIRDENSANREKTISILSRLLNRNPAKVLPVLYEAIQISVSELDYVDSTPDFVAPTTSRETPYPLSGGTASNLIESTPAFGKSQRYSHSDHSLSTVEDPVNMQFSPKFTRSALDYTLSPYIHIDDNQKVSAYYSRNAHEIVYAAHYGSSNRDSTARVVSFLLRASQRMIIPYADKILTSLLPNTWSLSANVMNILRHSTENTPITQSPDVLSTSIVATLGELAAVVPDVLLTRLHVLIPLLVDIIGVVAQSLGLVHSVEPHSRSRYASRDPSSSSSGNYSFNPTDASMYHAAGGRRHAEGGATDRNGIMGPSGVYEVRPYAVIAPNTHPLLFLTVAIRTLGLLVENTGHVVVPYLDHPHFLGLLLTLLSRVPDTFTSSSGLTHFPSLSFPESTSSGMLEEPWGDQSGLFSTSSWSLRREILRTLGIWGALDPFRYKMGILAQVQQEALEQQSALQSKLKSAIDSVRIVRKCFHDVEIGIDVIKKGLQPFEGAPTLLGELGDVVSTTGLTHYSGMNTGPSARLLKDGCAGGSPHRISSNALLQLTNGGKPAHAHSSIVSANSILIRPNNQPTGMTLTSTSGDSSAVLQDNGWTIMKYPWDLASNLPPVLGLAVGGGIAIDPLEAALAGLAGEPGCNVGVNLDELGVTGAGGVMEAQFGIGGETDGFGLDSDGLSGLLDGTSGLSGFAHARLVVATLEKSGSTNNATNLIQQPLLLPGLGVGLTTSAKKASLSVTTLLPSSVASHADYPATVAMVALVGTLSDPTLGSQHNAAVAALALLLRTLGRQCLPYLHRIVPIFLRILKNSIITNAGALLNDPGFVDNVHSLESGSRDADRISGSSGLRDVVLTQLAQVIIHVRSHYQPFLPATFAILRLIWAKSMVPLLRVMEATALAMGEISRPYIVSMIPHLLSVLNYEGTRPVAGPTPPAESKNFMGPYSSAVGSLKGSQRGKPMHRNFQPSNIAQFPSGRQLTRQVLQTIVFLTYVGRQAFIVPPFRRLLDDHYPLLITAIARVIDQGVGYYVDASSPAPVPNPSIFDSNRSALPVSSSTSILASADVASNPHMHAQHLHGPSTHIVRSNAIETILSLTAAGIPMNAHLSTIVPALVRIIADPYISYSPVAIRQTALDCLSLLALYTKQDFIPWILRVNEAAKIAQEVIGASLSDPNKAGAAALEKGMLPKARPDFISKAPADGGADGSFHFASPNDPLWNLLLANPTNVSGVGRASPRYLQHELFERICLCLLHLAKPFASPVQAVPGGAPLLGFLPPPTLPATPTDLLYFLYDNTLQSIDNSGLRVASYLKHVFEPLLQDLNITGSLPSPLPSEISMLHTSASDIASYCMTYHQYTRKVDAFDSESTWSSPWASPSLGVGMDGMPTKLPIRQEVVDAAWKLADGRKTRDEWLEWFRRLAVELLRESPAASLRVCLALAQVHTPLALDLFNTAFVTLWPEMFDEYQESFLRSFNIVINSPNVPTQVLQALLSLAEFLEHDEKALPIDIRDLAALAYRVNASAEALHFHEMEYLNTDSQGKTGLVETLISLNSRLDQPEAAVGILKHAQTIRAGIAPLGFRASHASAGDIYASRGNRSESHEKDQYDEFGVHTARANIAPGLESMTSKAFDYLGDSYTSSLDRKHYAHTLSDAMHEGIHSRDVDYRRGHASYPTDITYAGKQRQVEEFAKPNKVADEMEELWYERLGRWQDALEGYERRELQGSLTTELILGKMRCYNALGEWEKLFDTSRLYWDRFNSEDLAQAIPLAARASWALGHWDMMSHYLYLPTKNTLKGAFFHAVLATRNLDLVKAQHYIDEARKLISDDIVGADTAHYPRLYSRLVVVQQLTELEEVGTFLSLSLSEQTAAAQRYYDHLKYMWGSRLRGMAKDDDVWQRILSVRSLILSPSECMYEWTKFAALCRKNGKSTMAFKVLLGLGLVGAPHTGEASSDNSQFGYYQEGIPGFSPRGLEPSKSPVTPGTMLAKYVDRTLSGIAKSPLASHLDSQGSYGFSASKSTETDAGKNIMTSGSGSANVTRSSNPADRPTLTENPSASVSPIQVQGSSGSKASVPYAPALSLSPTGVTAGSVSQEELVAELQASKVIGPGSSAHPNVIYAYVKHMWHVGYKQAALANIRELVDALDYSILGAVRSGNNHGASQESSRDASPSGSPRGHYSGPIFQGEHILVYTLTPEKAAARGIALVGHPMLPQDANVLRVQCHLRAGQWSESLVEPYVAEYGTHLHDLGQDKKRASENDPMATVYASLQSVLCDTLQYKANSDDSRPATFSDPTVINVNEFCLPQNLRAHQAKDSTAFSVPRGNTPFRDRLTSMEYATLMDPVLESFYKATHECGDRGSQHYRAWHAWAGMNFAATEYYAENLRREHATIRLVQESLREQAAIAAATAIRSPRPIVQSFSSPVVPNTLLPEVTEQQQRPSPPRTSPYITGDLGVVIPTETNAATPPASNSTESRAADSAPALAARAPIPSLRLTSTREALETVREEDELEAAADAETPRSDTSPIASPQFSTTPSQVSSTRASPQTAPLTSSPSPGSTTATTVHGSKLHTHVSSPSAPSASSAPVAESSNSSPTAVAIAARNATGTIHMDSARSQASDTTGASAASSTVSAPFTFATGGNSNNTGGSPKHPAELMPLWASSQVFPTAKAIPLHATCAVKAFFRAIALGRTRLKAYVLQDLLRLLTLWFKYAELPEVTDALSAGLASGAVSMEVWLSVVPQLIARISTPLPNTRRLLHQLLNDIGVAHPQALIYSITVTAQDVTLARREAAQRVLQNLKQHSGTLVEEASLVAGELIRVAIDWAEKWYSALDEASGCHFRDRNHDAMLAVLLPLHEEMINPGPQTDRERAFIEQYHTELNDAYARLLAFQKTRRGKDLVDIWSIYYNLFRSLGNDLQKITTLELSKSSPLLGACHNLSLSIPGTYSPGTPVVRLVSVCPIVDVITSKQRPRKVTFQASDGRLYSFLLKGNEDLRQDERVMQLFGLINTLLSHDGSTGKRDISIRRYAVTPLSHSIGVVGWVPDCDTIHHMVKTYRDASRVILNMEHRLCLAMAPMLDQLTPLQKTEVFRHATDLTTGQDIARTLWLRSPSAEVWIDRRGMFSRSLAVMSIAGYVLGLGDRHPSNIMLDRTSGKIIHIDFGDCFEVTMTREKFPERVPFRLTRMFVAAMEVGGVEGSFRFVGEGVMRVLRAHRASLMAMLEAFVHDPLISWRLGPENKVPTVVPPVATTATTAASTPASATKPASSTKSGSTTPLPVPSSILRPSTTGADTDTGSGAGASGQTADSANPAAAEAPLRIGDVVLTSNEAHTFAEQGQAFTQMAESHRNNMVLAEIGLTEAQGDVAASVAGSFLHPPKGSLLHRFPLKTIAAHKAPAPAPADAAVQDFGSGSAVYNILFRAGEEEEVQNSRALVVLRRINAKLTGKDFLSTDPIANIMGLGVGTRGAPEIPGTVDIGLGEEGILTVSAQMQRLVLAATSHENLAQSYAGWCPWW